jgi:hypothetical protein
MTVMKPTDRRQATALALESALAKIQISDLQRELLQMQWVGMVQWMDTRASRSFKIYAFLRLVTVIGSVLIPAFVALTPAPGWETALRVSTFSLGLLVAIATAIESLFRTGDRWRHYRRNTEALRREGILFLMLTGPYAKAAAHEEAFSEFATRLNGILSTEVDDYFTQVAIEKPGQETGQAPAIGR